MKRMKRSLALLLVLTGLLSTLAACGSGNGADNDTNGVIEVTFWHSQDGEGGEITEAQVKAFNEGIGAEKGIHVTTVFQSWPGTEAFIAAMAQDDTANMPDVIQLYSEHVNIVRDFERLVWAEDYLNEDGATMSKDDLIPTLASAYSINGRMIAMPYNPANLVLYYNMDYLRQAGYDHAPTTIAEMAEMLPALVQKTDAEYGLNLRFTSFEFTSFLTKVGPNGTYMGNNNSGRTGYMTEMACGDELMAFLTEWQKVVDTGVYKPTRDSIAEEFAQGIHAMIITSSSNIVKLDGLIGDSFEWGVAEIPSVNETDAAGATPSSGALFMIDRDDTAKQAAARTFIEYMASVDAQVMWHEKSGYIPVNVHAPESAAYQAYIADIPQLAVPYQSLMASSSSQVTPFFPNNDAVEDVIKNAMLSFGQGTASVEDTYAAIMDGCASAFTDYYRTNPID